MKNSPDAVDEYIAGFPADVQRKLESLRALVRRLAPDAEEKISYGIPTFVLGKNLVHFGAYANHIGLYPTPSGIAHFQDELAPYKRAKASVQFPLDQQLPLELIEQIVAFRIEEVRDRAKSKEHSSTLEGQK